MDYANIEKKWNEKWERDGLYRFDEKNLDKKYYLLEMFSYPSGLNLHLGHWWNFGLSDSFGRFKRMQGYNVFQPMGFDSFGLPAENYALKTGIHPEDSTLRNISVMENQLKNIGGTFNWEYELITCKPEYYKWTQWLFVQLYKNGLAYQKEAPVNWCPSCNTVIANEQVVEGVCERCGTEVIRKNMKQWFFKITNYAERLLLGLDNLDWPQKTKLLQKNWIGKSIGCEVDFKTEDGQNTLTVFTSRVDTIFGVSWLVIAPEHPLLSKLVTPENEAKVKEYVEKAAKKDEIARSSTNNEKTGVFTGTYVINPLNGNKVPLFVADYVIASYATGIVMGVAAHDERDYDFAKVYNVPVVQVIQPLNEGKVDLPYVEYGKLINSGEFDGLTSEEAKIKIVEKLEKIGAGRKKVNYKLRDWSVSRQRYWGCPIPIIHCPKCGAVPVPEEQLPVLLPRIHDYKPEGEGPLGKVEEYMSVKCPVCGQNARRDPDTLDAFVCSSFYQLRYPDVHNDKQIFSSEKINKICPVDTYVGGVEHATAHLLYSRFVTKFLYDLNLINFDEPFKRLVHQGMVLGSDGKKMSKRNGGKTADEYVNEFGSDALRLTMMFSMNYVDGGPWNDEGLKHMTAFMDRIDRIVSKWASLDGENNSQLNRKEEQDLEYARAYCVKEMTESFEVFSFNTAIARLMELVNAMYKYDKFELKNNVLAKNVALDVIKLIAPAAPHFAEELWQNVGEKYSVHNQKYPVYEKSKLIRDSVEVVLQVNSKIVARMEIPSSSSNQEAIDFAKSNEKIKSLIDGKNIIKEIVVPGRLINIIVK